MYNARSIGTFMISFKIVISPAYEADQQEYCKVQKFP